MTEIVAPPFREFSKIPRLSRQMIVTEKIDGTNGVVYVGEDDLVLPGSPSRWLTPEQDHFGFAAWVKEHEANLRLLGPGYHFGEWWGEGIQRGYGIKGKRWSLFNVKRWGALRPECCHVVPVLYEGPFDTAVVEKCLLSLATFGSQASVNFMRPEGVVVYHVQGNLLFKKTLEKDEEPKSRG